MMCLVPVSPHPEEPALAGVAKDGVQDEAFDRMRGRKVTVLEDLATTYSPAS